MNHILQAVALAASLMAMMTTSQASNLDNTDIQCDESSPYLMSMGEQYFNIEPFNTSPLASLQRVDFARIRTGYGIHTECFKSSTGVEKRKSVVTLDNISVALKADKDSTHAVIRAHEYNDKLKRSRLRDIVLPLIDGAVPATANMRKRQNTEVGSYLRETALSITRRVDGFTVQQSIYVNGSLAEWLTWNLYH